MMPSGAAHDTMCVADRVPSAMVFVPCKDGISHSPGRGRRPSRRRARGRDHPERDRGACGSRLRSVDAVLLGLLAGALFGAMRSPSGGAAARRRPGAAAASVIAGDSRFLRRRRPRAAVIRPTEWSRTSCGRSRVVGSSSPASRRSRSCRRYAAPGRPAPRSSSARRRSARCCSPSRSSTRRFGPAMLAGTALIVAGGAVLAFDPGRPAGFRMLGVVLALIAPRYSRGATTRCASRATSTHRRSTAPPRRCSARRSRTDVFVVAHGRGAAAVALGADVRIRAGGAAARGAYCAL